MTPLFYCMAAFTMIFVVMNLFDNLSEFVEAKTPLSGVLLYYASIIPSSLEIMMPISMLLAVLYSLSQLTKHQELTAMIAGGISLYRLMVPFVAVSVISSVFVLIVSETVVPTTAYWSDQFLRFQKKKGQGKFNIATHLAYKNEHDFRIWLIEEFDTRSFSMKNVTVTQERADGSIHMKIHAGHAFWLDGRWWFSGVAVQAFDERGNPVRKRDREGDFLGSTRYERNREMKEWSESPQDFLNEVKDHEFLAAHQLLNFIKAHRSLSDHTINRVRVDLHHALAMPWMCIVVTLLGIPFGAQTGRSGAFLGIVFSLGLFFGYYFLIPLGLWMGKSQVLSPWLSAWLPNLTFLTVAVVLLYRMR